MYRDKSVQEFIGIQLLIKGNDPSAWKKETNRRNRNEIFKISMVINVASLLSTKTQGPPTSNFNKNAWPLRL